VINEWLMEQLIMVDALEGASAKVTVVWRPSTGGVRQDKKGRGREPISARLVADLPMPPVPTATARAADLHAACDPGFLLDGPVDHLCHACSNTQSALDRRRRGLSSCPIWAGLGG
jgi:ribose-phosphate pyrophosphokinase